MLADANKRFADAAAAIKAQASAWNDFASAAGLLVQILGAIALF